MILFLTGEFQRDVGGQKDQGEGDEDVVEGEVVLVELAVGGALVPVQVDVVLHEEGRHEHAVQQVEEGDEQDGCKVGKRNWSSWTQLQRSRPEN